MFCEHCGAELREGAKFCTKCGTPVAPPKVAEEKAETAEQSAVEKEALLVIEPVAQPEPVTEPEPDPAAPSEAPVFEYEPTVVYRKPLPTAPAPAAPPEPEPAAAVEPEPAAAVEPEPAAAVEPEPAAAVEPEPAAAVEPEPAAAVEPEPEPVQVPEGAVEVDAIDETLRPSAVQTVQGKPAKPAKKGSKALSVILCIFFFLTAFAASALGIVRIALSDDHIDAMLANVDLNKLELTNAKNGEKLSLAEYLWRTGDKETIEAYGITQEDVEELLEELEWEDYVSDVASDYAACFLDGDAFELDESDFEDLIEDNAELIADSMNGLELDDKQIAKRFEDVRPMFELSGLKKTIGFDPAILSYALSFVTLIVAIALAVVFALLILFVNRFGFKAWLSYVGMTGIILGALMLIGIGAAYLLSLVGGNMLLGAVVLPNIVVALIIGGSFFAVGILMFAVACLIPKKD